MGSSSSEQIIGYKYYAGIHMVICHGPVDAITYIEAGEKKVWEGSITSNQSLSIDKPNLFGGEKKEGGISGNLDVLFGDMTQGQNSYLQKKLGSNIPAYRGVFSLVLKKMYLTAMTQYIKAWAVRVRRIPSKTWQPSYGNINGGANPAHIIREVITHKSWGMGLSEAKIDESSFAAAAAKLYSEGFGLSLPLTGQTPCEDFIKEILRHVSGVLYNDRITGNFKLKLIRDDYDINSLPSFDVDNIISFNSFERPQFAEMVNEVILVYRPQGQKDKQSVSIQDLASIQAQGGVISQTITYIGIDNQDIAARVAQRELRQYSTPLAQIRITVNRDGWKIEPGGAFKLSWPSHGISNMVCRATSINLGDYRGHQIIIDAVEDIFSLPTTSYLSNQIPQWIDPVSDPVAAPSQVIKELPYWNIKRQFSPSALAELDALSSYIQLIVESPTVASPGYLLKTKPAAAAAYVDQFESEYSPKAKLAIAIGYSNLSISLKDVTGNLEDVAIGTYAYLENELVRIDSINLTTLVLTIGRGCLDSVPTPHAVDAIIWFAEELCGIDYTEYLVGDSLNAKALVRTGAGLLDESAAPTSVLAMTGRQNKPYPPGKVRINTQSYPDQISGQLAITWAHRDRTLQLAKPIVSEESGNIGPETGATYSLKLYDENNVVRVNQSGLTTTSYTWTTEEADSLLNGRLNEYIRLQLWTVRSGISSAQMCDFSIYRPQPPFNIIKPYISGVADVGEVLSVSDGVWDFSPTSFTYQWIRNYAAIPGATSSTYLVEIDDDGSYLRCRITAVNSVGIVVEESINFVQIGTVSPYWTPLDITSAVLACWYRSSDSDTIVLSDASFVEQWKDKSIYSRDLFQTVAGSRPQYLNEAILADGVDDSLNSNVFSEIPDGTQNAYTMVVVTTPQENQPSIPTQTTAGTGFYSQRSLFNIAFEVIGNTETETGPVAPVLSVSGNAIALTETRNKLAPFLISRSITAGVGNKSSVVIKRTSAGATSSSVNFETAIAGLTAPVLNLSWTRFQTPSKYGDSNNFNGSVYEALVLLGTLSDTESKKLEGYLAWNNGLVDKLPSNHLYKLEPPLNLSVWDPSDLNLLRWYKADTLSLNDGDSVSSWTDSSPNADPAIQTTPSKQPVFKAGVANGHAAIRFDSIDDVLNFSEILDTSAAKASIFVISKLNSGLTGRVLLSNRSISVSAGYTLRMGSTTQIVYFHAGYSPNLTAAAIDNSFNLMEVIRNGLTVSIGTNGSLGAASTISGYTASSYNLTAIGAEDSGGAGFFGGDISEIIIVPDQVDPYIRSRIEGYLCHKYGISSLLPTTHPYSLSPPLKKTYYYDLVKSMSPSHYWKVNETSGTSLVPITGGLSASLSGAYTLGVAGLVYADSDKAIEFTSTTGYGITDLDSGLALGTSDFTACAIIKFTTTAFSTVFGVRAGTDVSNILFLLTTSRITAGDISAETWAWQDTNTRVRKSGMNDGKAHPVTIRYTHSTMMMDLWIDGALADSRAQTAGRPTSSQKAVIGNDTNFIQGFTGVFDEPILFNRALSDSEITFLHHMSMGV